MAEVFYFHVQEDRSIKYKLPEPIMQEDKDVATWRFRIPKILNEIDMSAWSWWFVYVNAKGQEFSELLTLVDDIDEPDSYCTADYSIDYGISYHPGNFQFSLEAINADSGGEVLNEWHTKTYAHKVDKTLQGNQVQWSETESDIISALIVEVQNKVRQLVGGATPEPKSLIADMTDTKKVYLYVGEETGESTNYWYYYNGSAWVAGGLYASGITVDAVPTPNSTNAVQSGGTWNALNGKVSKPTTNPDGTAGQVLRTNGDGSTSWVNVGLPTDEQTAEAVSDWLDEHPEATTTVQDGSLTLAKIKNAVDPDQFTGSDSQKIAQAINSLPNGGTVLLGRKYTLTANVIITRNSNNGVVVVRPVNGESIIDCGEYEFGGEGVSNGKTGGILFDGVRFNGNGNLIDGYYLIRVFFRNCYFNGFNSLLYSSTAHIIEGNQNRYLQTVYFDKCIIRGINDYIINVPDVNNVSTRLYDIRINNCIIEWSYGVIRGGWWQGVYITDNAIEGFTSEAALFCEMILANSAVIKNNYFEKNIGTTIDLTSYAIGNNLNFDISDNYFSEHTKQTGAVIMLPKFNPAHGVINITGNLIIFPAQTSAYGVYVSDETSMPLSNVNVVGNSLTVYDPNNRLQNKRVLSELYDAELYKIKNVVDQNAGKKVTLNIPITLVCLSKTIARAAIGFPFVVSNNAYTIEIVSLNVVNLGNLTDAATLYQQINCGIIVNVEGTFTNGLSYTGSILIKVTFA